MKCDHLAIVREADPKKPDVDPPWLCTICGATRGVDDSEWRERREQ